MALKSALNKEMRRLKNEAKNLERKRAQITENIDEEIAENAQRQDTLQQFMDASFGSKQKTSPARGKSAAGTRRKRQSRKGTKELVLNAINASPGGVKRNAIIQKIGMDATDEAGHQYVSNMLRQLMDEDKIANVRRMYYPKNSQQETKTELSSASDDLTSESAGESPSLGESDDEASSSSGFGPVSQH